MNQQGEGSRGATRPVGLVSARLRILRNAGRQAALIGLALFAGAGTVAWPEGWILLGLIFVPTTLSMDRLVRRDAGLLEERLKPLFQTEQPGYDRFVLLLFVALGLGWLVLSGADAVRFGWSEVPIWIKAAGGTGVLASMWLRDRVLRENSFLARAMRLQEERGHRVVSSGPYAVVRHPLYAGMLLLMPCAALALGSLAGLAATLVLGSVLIIRTRLEDRELRQNLVGYVEYSERVTHRLVPWVW